ncbi:MAG TPA: ribose-5-phosphate isomerase RpiA [Polyangiaceae bacterium]|jgi:ribose 5-phosphate isomerase A|nr:ribose-5-phosphate isomerase RpiA [Polyangiaceae bacterium]
MDPAEAKRSVARAALELLPEHGVVGLGTGSTATLFIDGVAELVRAGRKLVGVPTSDASRKQAERLGIPLLGDEGPWPIDVCVDGADEVSERLDLIKGGGGAHTREKIVNRAAKTNVIVVDESKLSRRLGERWKVPVEVLAFGRLATAERLGELGPVTLRLKDGAPWRTDSGNYIYDLAAGVLDDPGALETRLGLLPGVVESGLFVRRANVVLVAGAGGLRTLRAP